MKIKTKLSSLVKLFLIVSLFAVPQVSEAKRINKKAKSKSNICNATALAAFESCRLDSDEELALSEGKCLNNSEKTDRAKCLKAAKSERNESRKGCSESRNFRLELCKDLGKDAYDPEIDPANFLSPTEAAANPNPYLSLKPGTLRKFTGGGETTVVAVTNDTRVIMGVTTTIVSDVVSVNGKTVEDTQDFYAQDKQGNVWYFGERVLNYDEEGYLEDLDGSFIAGKNGAKPGIAMKANPLVGDKYRQEFALSEAEDIAEIISLNGDESAPAASCGGSCLVVKETLPSDPEVVEYKYYIPGIGFILAIDQESNERADELTEIINP